MSGRSRTLAIHELLRTYQVPRTVVAEPSIRPRVRDRAKVVVCIVDGTPIQALVPSSLVVNLERLSRLTGGDEIRLAHEDEGFGPSAGEGIFVDVRLALSHEIAFTTETAAETVVLRWADFARSVRPVVGDFAELPGDRVGAYRLSYE
jgi:hypothetical protein